MMGRWLSLLMVVGLASMVGGCVVETSDDDDLCIDDDYDNLCDDGEDPCLDNAANDCACVDDDFDDLCDVGEDPCPGDPENVCGDCPDADADLLCDDDGSDPCLGDPTNTCDVCYYDGDGDGICDDVDDCIGDEGDDDGDGVCNGEDIGICIDDITGEDICADACIPIEDNYCPTPWDLTYCAAEDGNWYHANCAEACTTDDRVYGATCGGNPAITGECDAAGGVCVCWCEDSFDSCLNDYTVEYTRDGVTYDVDCKEYCFGTCDAELGACACP